MKKLIVTSLFALTLLASAGAVLAVDCTDTSNYGLGCTGEASGLAKHGSSLPIAIGQYINVTLSIIGIIFLILAIYGGFRILLSQGDATIVKKGRDIILYAVLGMIVISLAYALTTFIFSQLLSVPTSTSTTA